MREIKLNKVYRHFKGSKAFVVGIAKDSETMKDLVIYYCYESSDLNHKDGMYARSMDMFLSEVDHEKYPNVKQKYRFEEIGE